MPKLTLNDISSGYLSASAYNANNALIEAAIDNTLSRDGSTPNSLTADMDMNSFDINNVAILNVATVNVTALTVNGQAVTVTDTLTGGLAASEVTYDGGDLDTKLGTDFPKLADAETVAGAWTFSSLLTASAGVAVTGNISVTGTVDGVDVALLNTNAITKATAATGHTRAGSLQLLNDGQGTTVFTVSSSIVEDTFETVGPTGSGAQNIMADLDDAITAGARAILFKVRLITVTNDAAGSQTIFYSGSNDGSPSIANAKDYTAYISMDTAAAGGDDVGVFQDCIIPVDSNGIFKCTWSEINNAASSAVVELYYKGFVTD